MIESVRRKNQRGAKRSGIARRPRAYRARRVGESVKRNIARSLPFHWTPQETEPDVTQNGKGRQCVSATASGAQFLAHDERCCSNGRQHCRVADRKNVQFRAKKNGRAG